LELDRLSGLKMMGASELFTQISNGIKPGST